MHLFQYKQFKFVVILLAVLVLAPNIASASGSISVFKYNDLNNNGQYDEDSEPGLEGWKFTIGDESQTTDSDGKATFGDLTAGQAYEVCETLQAGWTNTDPSNGSGCKTVTAGSSSSSAPDETVVDAGGNKYTIEFLGTSNNGLTWNYKVSETEGKSLSHWVLGLCMPENNVVDWSPDASDSGIEGVEIVNDPTTGVFGIKWDLKDNYDKIGGDEDDSRVFSFTLDTIYPEGAVDVAIKTGGKKAKTAISTIVGPDCSANPAETVMFGNYRPMYTLGDFIWEDLDENGIQDANEPGIEGVELELYEAGGNTVLDTTTTGSNGEYLFEDLSNGEYVVNIKASNFNTNGALEGYSYSPQDAGSDDAKDSDFDSSTGKASGAINGADNLTVDGGFFQTPAPEPGSITVFKYHDLNSNGQRDDGEPGLEGWVFTIDNESQTTDSDGKATFGDLTAGQAYEVCETLQAGWTNSTPLCQTVTADAGSGTVVEGPASTTITLDDNKNSTYTISFVSQVGNTWTYKVEEIGGRDLSHWNLGIGACLDHITDHSPVQGYEAGKDGSTGFVGVKWDTPEAFSEGMFSFTLDGDYPVGTVLAQAKAGTEYNTGEIKGPDCSASPAEMVMFGNYQSLSSLGDRVWFDDNENGVQDDGELGVEGVTVKLYTCDDTFLQEMTTDTDGKYLFENLTPGEYYVEFSNLPDGYVFTAQGQSGASDPTDSDADPATGKTECTTLESGENDLTWDAGIVQGAGITKYQRLDDSDEWIVDPLYGLGVGDTISYQISVENFYYDENLGFTILDTLDSMLDFKSLRGVEKVDVDGNTLVMEENGDYFFSYNADLRELSLDYKGTLQSTETLNFLFDVTVNDTFNPDMAIMNQANVEFTGKEPIKSNIVEAYAVPEPSTLILLGLGLVGAFGLARKKRGA